MRNILLLLLIAAACTQEPRADTAVATDTVKPVVDSIFPIEEEVRRFKAQLNGATTSELRGGASSRDSLVHRFVRAVESSDTLALRAILIDPVEFIDLYYPTSKLSQPPYEQPPRIMWFLGQQQSETGISRLLQRYGGRSMGYDGHACNATPIVEGENRIWDGCVVTWQPPNEARRTSRLFGTILERGGSFKFVTYANDF